MARAEDELKRRFTDQEFTNDQIDSEDLWSSIANELDESVVPAGVALSKNMILNILVALTLIVVAVYYMCHEEIKPLQKTYTESTLQSESKNTQRKIGQTLENHTLQIEDEKLKTTNSIERTKATSNSLKLVDDIKINSQNQEDKNNYIQNALHHEQLNDKQTLLTVVKTKKSSLSKENIIKPSQIGTNVVENNNFKSLNNLIENYSITTSIEKWTTSPIALIAMMVKSEETLNIKPSRLNTYISSLSNENQNTKDKTEFQISILGGLNLHNFQYNSNNSIDLKDTKERSESSIIGYNVGLNASIIWNKKYLFSTGIEFNNLWSKLDHTNTTAFQEQRSDQLLKVWIDTETEDTIRVQKGEAIINGITRNRVVHHNKYNRYSIPLEIGMQKQLGKFELGMKTGVTLNFTTLQTGRTLDSDSNFVNFNKENQIAPFKSFDTGIRVSPYIAYKFNDQFSFRIHPLYSWSQGNSFDETDIKLNIHQFNLTFGLSYIMD